MHLFIRRKDKSPRRHVAFAFATLEAVGEVTKPEQMRNGADGQTEYVSTDVEAGAPLKLSYADMAKTEETKISLKV